MDKSSSWLFSGSYYAQKEGRGREVVRLTDLRPITVHFRCSRETLNAAPVTGYVINSESFQFPVKCIRSECVPFRGDGDVGEVHWIVNLGSDRSEFLTCVCFGALYQMEAWFVFAHWRR
ncbi:hypothetical protein CDAR_392291 [Caerostris darwini]|uniref:Uncharacterized protein n=1 Tax=Caerostris darwini TaxID=1538125 RepID=A0AAV4SRF3_9ARAC|nr:hypothetical protein CDAR_392291 [Caerostris darwini]